MMIRRAWAGVAAVLVTSASVAAQDGSLTTVLVTDGVRNPVYITHAPGDYDRIFIVSQRGQIHIVKRGTLLPTPFLDVGALSDCCNERGLLGLAFHPDYDETGRFFINYTDNAGDTVVARYQVSADPDVASAACEFVLTIEQPNSNHNAGWMDFGPDGFLYIATGDGGGQWDPGNAGQTITGELLGNILRIDVDGDDWPDDPDRNYAIPQDNPFVGFEGEDEIWAFGLRNPWRNAFDQRTGELYIADVGQATYEEVNVQPADDPGGVNYGWVCKEGPDCTDFGSCSCSDPSLIDPVHVYTHGGLPFRCSITGGEVYRGCAIPELDGTYFFADFCSDQIWSFRYVDGSVTDLRDRTSELEPGDGRSISGISSFGRDAAGELYICDLGGEVFKIVPDGAAAVSFLASEPPDGAIDARQPFDANGANPSGWDSVVLTFDGDPPALTMEDFAVSQSGGSGPVPEVVDVEPMSGGRVRVVLSRAVSPGAWTTIEQCETQTRVRLGYLPADVNGDGVSAASDILDLVDALNGVGASRSIWSLDIDRSGEVNATDVLQLVDLLKGAGAYPAYNLARLP